MGPREPEARLLKKRGGKNWVQRAAMRWRFREPRPHGKTHPRASSPRSSTHVNCVGSLLNTRAIWSCTNGPIQVRNLLNVTFVGNTSLRFAASGDVQRHIIIHSGEKPHLCDTCGRGFSNFSNLKEHKKTHTADKVFTCDECGKSFNMQRKLVKHRVRHTGERPYSCPACGKCFGGSGDLRRHVRTHTGEKPYSCEICSKCFTRSAVLRRHKKMHGRADARSPAVLGELSQAIETSDLERSQSSDSFSQDVSVTLMPVSVKLPGHPVESSVAAFDGHCTGSYCKLRSMLHPPSMSDQDKLGLDPAKLAKPQELQNQPHAYAYSDVDASADAEQSQADGMAVTRSSLATLDNHCTEPLGSRASSVTYRNSEGQFFSSMTLWGLAMKTLQNEHELEQ
ncbi:zinc finger and BTB domain-containing protein 49 isoform X4 [Peromyscus californicus insignis]|uniref:zinc finger and BTB domain-containing protein 49 isoform X4 n=1 Tax=Peromyscus californicus insignis TaxID=564181 RepID=UPI0022A7D8B4|nr:zinc finger and BTB domain-containing protein 49 isoform X4 [Peromyscus californicus insignis]